GPHGLYALVPAAVVAIDEGTGGTVRGVFSSLPPLPRHVGEASWTPPVLDASFLSSLVSPTRSGGTTVPPASPDGWEARRNGFPEGSASSGPSGVGAFA